MAAVLTRDENLPEALVPRGEVSGDEDPQNWWYNEWCVAREVGSSCCPLGSAPERKGVGPCRSGLFGGPFE